MRGTGTGADDTGTLPTLYGVSVGPGDPELMTVAAIRAIRESDVIAYPLTASPRGTAKIAADTAAAHLEGKELLEVAIPMGADEHKRTCAYAEGARRILGHLDAGRSVSWLSIGDVSLYSTFHHLVRHLPRGDYAVKVIPGVPSMCAAAARLQVPLALGDERLIVTSAADALADPAVLGECGTRVILKVGSHLEALADGLRRICPQAHASLAERVGLEGEALHDDLFEADTCTYLSLAIVREPTREDQASPIVSPDSLKPSPMDVGMRVTL